MGVPAFFRWLVKKYPRILTDMFEEEPASVGGVSVPVDLTQANPNGVEFDNLYLDMNGIIHPCVHPEDVPAPETEDEMFANICLYIDRLMAVVRPRKVLYMAIDGVAPRAKMNQQRSRRFKAAKEIAEQEDVEEDLRREMVERGHKFSKGGSKKKVFDHNVITPGTTFMSRLADRLRHYVHQRLSLHPGWRGLKVILSDASVPGEGEHKIMEFVRAQRAQPGYDPDTCHVLHGLDADLIMLGLATHEAHFHILREVMETRRKGGRGPPPAPVKIFRDGDAGVPMKPLQLLKLSVLREYLYMEFAGLGAPAALPFPFDLERVIDDFVFMCFFVGNDFLPHLPSLDIREGALDLILSLYKQLLPALDGYLTCSGDVALERVDVLLARIGVVEDRIFLMRKEREMVDKQDRARKEAQGYGGGRGGGGGAGAGGGRGRGRGRGGGAGAGGGRAPGILGMAPEKAGARGAQAFAAAADAGQMDLVSLDAKPMGQTAGRPGGLAGAAASAKAWQESRAAAAAARSSSNKSAAAALRSKLFGKSPKRARDDGESAAAGGDAPHGAGDDSAEPEADADATGPGSDDERDAKRPKAEVDIKVEEGTEDDDDVDGKADEEAAADGDDAGADEADGAVAGGEGGDEAEEEDEEEEEEEDDEDDDDEDDDEEDEMDDETRLALEASAGELKEAVKAELKARRELDEAPGPGARAYVEGLLWVFHYYYRGVASWRWYYPQHYAPFASDLVDVAKYKVDKWELGTPFRPMEQLMGVLPPRSSHALPAACHALMTEPSSSVIDFYPRTFAEDPNGHRFAWQFVALLPFVDEKRLVDAVASVEHTFTDEEKRRNRHGLSLVFCHSTHRLAKIAAPLVPKLGDPVPSAEEAAEDAAEEEADIAAAAAAAVGSAAASSRGAKPGKRVVTFACPDTDADGRGMAGILLRDYAAVAVEDTVTPPKGARADVVLNNQAVSARMELPPAGPHLSKLLEGAHLPPRELGPGERPARAPRMGRFHWLNTDLPLAFTGSVDIIKYTMLHFEESWSLMVRYTLYHAMPSAMLHRASVTRRAAHAADLSDAKRSKLQERSMLTRYKVYNFQPLSAAVASKQSDERAISAFAGDQRVAGRRDPLTPDAAAAMVTYTQIHPWTARHHAPRGGSASASCTSEDLAPFLSEHTAARLGMTPKQVAIARSSPAFTSASAGGRSGASPGDLLELNLPPASGGNASGAAPRTGRAAAMGRSRSVVELGNGAKAAASAAPASVGKGAPRGSDSPASASAAAGGPVGLAPPVSPLVAVKGRGPVAAVGGAGSATGFASSPQGGTGAGKTRSRSVAFLPEVDAGCGSTGAS
ncbi:hypothetical protein FNF27_00851 [Cafeteria roenbergensis]|uniref:Uncharacterized protein n=1 Tax=Cafeteria roenbergensis TaxID=33653 RepID=A0A5A8EJ95_CAFRO|nr:hypothetical protein FNF27_00851 [Cafeteria roenbergensis]